MYFSKIRQVVIAACCLVSLLCGAGPTFGQEATQEDEAFYVSFHVPGSTGTFPQAINDFASVTGNYLDATSGKHGFVRDIWGKIVKFDPAGSTSTTPTTINLEGTIAGSYTDAKQVQHGFVRYGTGKIKMFDPPGSIQTVAESINASRNHRRVPIRLCRFRAVTTASCGKRMDHSLRSILRAARHHSHKASIEKGA